jgi:hypothetical protein
MKAFNYVAVYLLWLVDLLFGLWFAFISRNTWLSAFQLWYIQGSPTRQDRANLLDKVFILILGLIWLILMIVYESYFRKGAEKGDLFRRFAKVTGPTVLAIFVVDAILALIQGLAIVGSLRFVVLLIELILGIMLIRFGWRKAIPPVPV